MNLAAPLIRVHKALSLTRPRSRHDLAAELGLSPARVSQLLTALKERGLAANLKQGRWLRLVPATEEVQRFASSLTRVHQALSFSEPRSRAELAAQLDLPVDQISARLAGLKKLGLAKNDEPNRWLRVK